MSTILINTDHIIEISTHESIQSEDVRYMEAWEKKSFWRKNEKYEEGWYKILYLIDGIAWQRVSLENEGLIEVVNEHSWGDDRYAYEKPYVLIKMTNAEHHKIEFETLKEAEKYVNDDVFLPGRIVNIEP